jgi:hypothetical protein
MIVFLFNTCLCTAFLSIIIIMLRIRYEQSIRRHNTINLVSAMVLFVMFLIGLNLVFNSSIFFFAVLVCLVINQFIAAKHIRAIMKFLNLT